MGERWVRVIADDLTGACDVAAALLPSRRRVVVGGIDAVGDADALVVRNTQSRTCAPADAAARVRRALADVPSVGTGDVLKKIDTALRGHLGTELDAAMDACGAAQALVLAAIPEAGRTTVGGLQLADGVPVDRTPFARDPQNPVRDARVAETIASTSRRRVTSVGLDVLRRDGVAAVLARAARDGVAVVVGDAETDDDLREWLVGMGGDTIVLAGSTGLARAWRGAASWSAEPRPSGASARDGAGGILVVAGSAHPVGRGQLAHLEAQQDALVVDVTRADVAALASGLRAGRVVCLVGPDGHHDGGSAALLARLAETTARAIAAAPPRAMVLVGGETAYAVLGALGHPRLGVEGAPAPLAVRATVLDGVLAGMPLVTKGGSTGPPERLADLIAEVR